MTAKSKLEKLEKLIKPKRERRGRQVKITVPINAAYGTDAPDPVIEIEEGQVNQMDQVLDLVYGEKDNDE